MSFYNWDMLPISPDRPGIVHRRIFGDEIQIQHLISEPGGTPPELHNHPDHEEILYVQAGEWECTLGNEIRKIRQSINISGNGIGLPGKFIGCGCIFTMCYVLLVVPPGG